MNDLYAIVLAGGLGTRLWPLSRQKSPKQLLPLVGKESLLVITAKRLLHSVAADRLYTVTHQDHCHEVLMQLEELNPKLADHIFSEPEAKNTLPAMAWMTALIAKENPNAMVSVFPSDHAIKDEAGFTAALKQATGAAHHNGFVLFGIKPGHASSEYGYIETNSGVDSTLTISRFVEKPGLEKAKEYLASGRFYWNSGMFVFKAQVFLEALKKYQPEIFSVALALSENSSKLADASLYAKLPNLSIDYGLMEQPVKKALIPVDIGWSDLGHWPSVHDFLQKNGNGNASVGPVINKSNKNSFVANYTNEPLVTLGLTDAVVIKTHDATLVAGREAVRDIKGILDEVKKFAPQTLKSHRRENRPWGFFRVIEEGPGYKVKYITVNAGESLSLQRHKKRTEHWVIVQGQARVRRDDKTQDFKAGDYIFIGEGCKHQLVNSGHEPLVVIETQRGDYLGEDDIERLEDKYGRIS